MRGYILEKPTDTIAEPIKRVAGVLEMWRPDFAFENGEINPNLHMKTMMHHNGMERGYILTMQMDYAQQLYHVAFCEHRVSDEIIIISFISNSPMQDYYSHVEIYGDYLEWRQLQGLRRTETRRLSIFDRDDAIGASKYIYEELKRMYKLEVDNGRSS